MTSGAEITGGTPSITFAGYTIGSPSNNPQRTGEHNYQVRDDFTTAYQLGGRHDVKIGGDFTTTRWRRGGATSATAVHVHAEAARQPAET